MKIHITGIAGVLGSTLANHLLERGYTVAGNDVIRFEEAWKLDGIKDKIEYKWKSTEDLKRHDLQNVDVLIDCGLPVPDRPVGISSPVYTVLGNILPPTLLLETVKSLNKKPICIYPSSFNSLYGHAGQEFTEETKIAPSSVYGWTKGVVEELYLTYARAYGLPVIITRVGSAFGPKMRSDELVAKLIIHCLKNKPFKLKSPMACRLWTYAKDVLSFYTVLLEQVDKHIGKTLHCAGNKEGVTISNVELATKIQKITGNNIQILEDHYEPGELINGKPVNFTANSDYTQKELNWKPRYTLDEGIKETANWFKENLWRYTV